jgi:hypothetical protein
MDFAVTVIGGEALGEMARKAGGRAPSHGRARRVKQRRRFQPPAHTVYTS